MVRMLASGFSWMSLGFAMFCLILGAGIWVYGRDLPSHAQLADYDPPTISRIFSSEGQLIDQFAKEKRLFSPIGEIPDLVKHAIISAEDKNFYSHKGYDPVGMLKAAFDVMRGGRLRGASTITQQVLKNFLLSNERSVNRKIKEIVLAARVEHTLSKDRILELYLNEIFLGQNSFGVTAAAKTYFDKQLEQLTVEEAAYLAALPKAPSTYHPVRQKDRAVARRNFVIQEMIENGYIDQSVGRIAKAAELKTVIGNELDRTSPELPPRSYFTDEIRRQLSDTFGENEFFTGGLVIRATIDRQLQLSAESALRKGLEKYDRSRGVWRGTEITLPADMLEREENWRTALENTPIPRDVDGWHVGVVLKVTDSTASLGIEDQPDNENNFVPANDMSWIKSKAMAGVRSKVQSLSELLTVGEVVMVAPVLDANGGIEHWSLRQLPVVQGAFMAMDANSGRVLAMQGGFSYQQSDFNRTTQANRQPGSAFKPFVYAAALDAAYTPAAIIIDAPIEIDTPEGIWRPMNSSEKFFGPAPLRTGIEYSRNLMTVRLARDVGMDKIADYAEEFGIYDSMDEYLANSLGAQETTLFKMISGYAMFANGGERVEPTLVDRVQDRWGQTVYRHDRRMCINCSDASLPQDTIPQLFSTRKRVIDGVTAYQVTSMMQGVVERGTASRTVNVGVPVAGKTGTTNDSRDAWFIGYTADIVAGCYIGFDQPRSLGKHAYGGTLCGPIFNEFMLSAVERYGAGEFKIPDDGVFVNIDRRTGGLLLDESDESRSLTEFFRKGTEPVEGEFRIVDGGFLVGSDLIPPDGSELNSADSDLEIGEVAVGAEQEEPETTSFGSLSSGGLY